MERDKIIDKSGKTPDEALEAALAEWGLSRDDAKERGVVIEVIDEGKKGLFGLGFTPATVRLTLPFEPARFVDEYLKEVSRLGGLEITSTVERRDDKRINASIAGKDMGVLIGKRGATLDSLQYLLNLSVNKGDSPFISVSIDTENYRERRKETLEILARNLARKVRQTREAVTLEPMNANERRIIHSALQHDKYVSTHSEGDEPFRNIIIAPTNKLKNKPFNRQRNRPDGAGGGQGGAQGGGGSGSNGGNGQGGRDGSNRNDKKRFDKIRPGKPTQRRVPKPEEKSTLFVSKPLDKRYFDKSRPFNYRPKTAADGEGEAAGNEQKAEAVSKPSNGKPPIKTYKADYEKYKAEKAAQKVADVEKSKSADVEKPKSAEADHTSGNE